LEIQKLEEKQRIIEKERKRRQLCAQLDRFYKRKLAERARQAKESLDFELELLSRVAEIEAQERKKNKELQQKYCEETAQYLSYLRHLRVLEAQREREAEQMFLEDEEATWKQREHQWALEDEKRKNLLQQVLKTREEQRRFRGEFCNL
jgi:hypothetical protein